MTQQQLNKLLKLINDTPNNADSDELSTALLQMTANALALDTLKSLTATKQNLPQAETPAMKPPINGKKEKFDERNLGYIHFTKKELSIMPKKFQASFIIDNRIVKYRYRQGMFQARYRREGFHIEVASKDYETMKRKFMARLIEQSKDFEGFIPLQKVKKSPNKIPLFGEYGAEWLKIKKQTTKPSTFKEYERSFNVNLKPKFGHLPLTDIKRSMVQSYLFEFIEQGKHRTAEKLKLQLNCIFDLATEDYGISSPVKKVVLPYHESKKGTAFTKAEERKLVEYCIANPDGATTSALLVLLYFGLRQSELKSLQIIDGKYLQCETSKERMGRNVVLRKIPFTPMVKKVLAYVDFEKAKTTNLCSIGTTVKRLFPNHHPHELRYTFITRCKECGVNPELVMLWDGHSFDKDVKTSEVDRGYTDYSEEYVLSEAEKVHYSF